MKSLIVYSTRYGFAKSCAMRIKESLTDDTKIVHIEKETVEDIKKYELVIIGASIYAGEISNNMKNFIDNNLPSLLNKKVGLYTCGMEDYPTSEQQFNNVFPEKLRKTALAKGYFGGRIDFKKMSPMDRAITTKMAGIKKSVEKIYDNNIQDFIMKIIHIQ